MPSDVDNEIDRMVGARIRKRREELGLSQSRVADSLHISFQQIQKYETGRNRVSVSRLFAFMILFKVESAYFFQDIRRDVFGFADQDVQFDGNDDHRSEIDKIADAFPLIRDRGVRDRVIGLVEALARATML